MDLCEGVAEGSEAHREVVSLGKSLCPSPSQAGPKLVGPSQALYVLPPSRRDPWLESAKELCLPGFDGQQRLWKGFCP